MKKIIVMILAVVMVLGVAGCRTSIPGDSNDSGGVAANETADTASVEAQENSSTGFILPYEFTAVDIYGNTVTNETLGEKQMFFVHLWATWCPPCIREMPDLAILAHEYKDSVGFIGLLDDFDNAEGAINIKGSAGIPDWFVALDANDPSLASLLEMVKSGFVPTTVLITEDGVSEQIIGALGTGYAEHLEKLLR